MPSMKRKVSNHNVYEVSPEIIFQFYVNSGKFYVKFWIKEQFEAGIRNFTEVSF